MARPIIYERFSGRKLRLRHRPVFASQRGLAKIPELSTHIRIKLAIPPHKALFEFKIPLHTFTMASRPAARALRQTARQLAASPAQKRTFVSALRAGVTAVPKAAVTAQFQQTRGVKTIDFAGHKEKVFGKSGSTEYR